MKLDEIVMVGEAIADAVKAWDIEKVEPSRLELKTQGDRIKELTEENMRLDRQIRQIFQMFKDLPTPTNGVDGKDGAPGKDGRDGIDGKDGTNGIDGKDGAAGIDGKDGAAGLDGKPGEKGLDGRDGRDGLDGRNGKDGATGIAGKDALEIEPQSGMDESASYQRGTWVAHRGGLFRAFRTTDPVKDADYAAAGWQMVVCGMDDVRVELAPDSRTLLLSVETTDGKCVTKSLKMPVQIYRGVYREGIHYDKGDTVTHGGSTWHANEGTSDRPGESSKAWTLTTKRGSNGKDAGENK